MRKFGDRLAGQFGSAPVQRESAIGYAELAERGWRATKTVGLQGVATRRKIAAVDLADQVGAALVEDLGAVLEPEKVALDVEIERLYSGAHRAVAEHDPVGEVIEKMRHHAAAAAGRFA